MRFYALFLVNCLALYSCGPDRPDLKKAPSKFVEKPAFEEASQVLALTGGKNKEVFEGTSLIWDPHGKTSDHVQVIEFSGNVKAAKAQVDGLYLKIAPMLKQIAEIDDKYEDTIARLMQPTAEQLESIHKNLSAQREEVIKAEEDWLVSNPAARVRLASFCPAALWHFAVSDELRSRKFSERPTPFSLCEPYYKEKNIFEQCASDDGDYFSCIWRGVLNTRIAKFTGEGKQQVERSLDSGVLRNQLASKAGFANALKTKGKFDFPEGAVSVHKSGMRELFKNKSIRVLRHADLSSAMKLNDLLHNRPLMTQGADLKDADLKEWESEAGKLSAGAKALGGKPVDPIALSPTAQALEQVKFEKTRLQSARAEKQKLKLALDEKARKFQEAKVAAATFISSSQVALAMLAETGLSMEVLDNNVLQATLTFDRSKFGRGCFHLENKIQVDCPKAETVFEPMVLEYDVHSGMMRLSIAELQVEKMGLGFKGRDRASAKESYQYLEAGTLEGNTLEFEIYPRVVAGVLQTLTGSINITKNSESLYLGSVTLFRPAPMI